VNPLQAIAAWAAGPAVESLPESGVALVKRAFLDTIAVTLLGSRLDAPRIAAKIELERGARAQASLYGMRVRTDVLSAALVNGTSAHAELFDDNNAPMIAHPSAPLVTALLALGEARGARGRDVLYAYAAGFEIGVKLGRMLNPALYEHGWHATRVLGILGTTAACGRLLALSAERISAALGIAASMASGIRQNFGTMTMALHAGLTARDAVHAALLAQRGYGADPAALDGKYGFFALFAGQQPELLPLGEPFELLASGIIFKPYPSGAPTHAAVDAALALRGRLGGDLSRINRITCFVHPWNEMTLREEEPRDALQAKVNLRYCIAAALRHGELGFRQFTESALGDPVVTDLRRRIDVQISRKLPDNGEFPAELRITTTAGEELVERRDVPPGGSTRPLGEDQVIAKLRACAAERLGAPSIERVIELVRGLEHLESVAPLCTALQ
jgi:2-methylcitrate dehydratase PrpD